MRAPTPNGQGCAGSVEAPLAWMSSATDARDDGCCSSGRPISPRCCSPLRAGARDMQAETQQLRPSGPSLQEISLPHLFAHPLPFWRWLCYQFTTRLGELLAVQHFINARGSSPEKRIFYNSRNCLQEFWAGVHDPGASEIELQQHSRATKHGNSRAQKGGLAFASPRLVLRTTRR